MRRLTKAQPIGGAWLCSLISSVAYSGGSASGMVASSCATFMIGPLSPPSAAASSSALAARFERHAEEARAGKARRGAAELGADIGVAPRAGGEAVFLGVSVGGIRSLHSHITGRCQAHRME